LTGINFGALIVKCGAGSHKIGSGIAGRQPGTGGTQVKIEGNTFVVTGAAQGLGAAISLRLAERGARLALLDVNPARLDETLAACKAKGADGYAFSCNVADETNVRRSFVSVEEHLGPITGLVNNAGILDDAMLVKFKDGEIVDRMSLQKWQRVIDVNLTGVFLCGREAVTSMIRNGKGGVIVNISSISRLGNIGQSNYAAAKAGVAALSATWAQELARYGIRSAAIAPGVFETEMVASLKPEAHERITSAVPLNRTGTVEELAHAVEFIIENDYYSGRILEIDGGLRL
jgi:3-oxoacyl-[acyl-carrier protein] reductase